MIKKNIYVFSENRTQADRVAAEHPNHYTIAALYSKVKECSKYREATDIDKVNGGIDVMNILPSRLVIAHWLAWSAAMRPARVRFPAIPVHFVIILFSSNLQIFWCMIAGKLCMREKRYFCKNPCFWQRYVL